MKITILSDFHFGFAAGTEREEDAFEAAKEAIERSIDSDVILIAGDMFDTRVPSTEVFVRAMQLLTKPMHAENGVRISKGISKKVEDIPLIKSEGIPVIAIHGTHERRVRGLMNPVEALERAGFLIYLHCNGVVLEKNGEKICIQGMSGVPDQFSAGVLDQWNPKPVENCFNIFMFHQSLSPFMYAPHLLPVEKLPRDFDLYICGHMHEPKKSVYRESPFIIPGSLVTTQITKESMKPMGFWSFETESRKSEFRVIENQRKVYYVVMDTGNLERDDIENEIGKILETGHKKKPIVRIKLKGKEKNLPLDEIKSRFVDKAIVSFRKETEEEKIQAKTLEEHRLSVQELWKKLLYENLRELKLNPKTFEHVFELLLENKIDEVMDLLKNE
ncbi:MAG: DNA repair exonuclease [Candidatus Aenigmatarchaeota archaeon]|nr:MAG: DNA repair exonuclease [Candidatus Aenigmarchaeota archaeon]